MGALAQTERVATGRAVEVRPRSRQTRAPGGRRTTEPRLNWNVLAEEIVPFPDPEMPSRDAGARHRVTKVSSAPAIYQFPVAQARRSGATELSAARARDKAVRAATPRVAFRPRGLRRLLPGAVALVVLVGIWLGAGALSGLHRPVLSIPATAVRIHGGYLYVARPGDTLWSIASHLEPNGDPRPLVASFEQQLHGAELVAGDQLRLP